MSWGGDWSKKISEGVEAARKQVQQQVADSGKPKAGAGSGSRPPSAGSDGPGGKSVESLQKRVVLLEGVIKKLIPVKEDPSKLAELWEKGVSAGKQLETLEEEGDRRENLLRESELRIEQLTIELSSREDELHKAKQSLEDGTTVSGGADGGDRAQGARHVEEIESLKAFIAKLQEGMRHKDEAIAHLEAASGHPRPEVDELSSLGTKAAVVPDGAVGNVDRAVSDAVSEVVRDVVESVCAELDRDLDNGSWEKVAWRQRHKITQYEKKIDELSQYIAVAEERTLRAQENLRRELEESPNVDTLWERIRELQGRLEDAESRASKHVRSANDKLRIGASKVDELDRALKASGEEKRKLEQRDAAKARSIAELQERNKMLTEQLKKTSELTAEREKQLKEARSDSENTVVDLKKALDAAQKEIRRIQADEDSAKDAHLAAEARCSLAMEELENVQNMLTEKTRIVEELEGSLSKGKLTISDLHTEVAQKDRELNKFKEKAKLAVAQRDSAIGDLRSEISVLHEQKSIVSETEKKLTQVQKQLDKETTRCNEQETQLSELTERLQSTQSALESSQSQSSTLSRDLEVGRQNAVRLERELAEQHRLTTQAIESATVNAVQDTEARMDARIKELLSEREKLTAKLKGLQNELRRQQSRSRSDMGAGPDQSTPSSAPETNKSSSAELEELRKVLDRVTVENIALQQKLSEADSKVSNSERMGGFLAL